MVEVLSEKKGEEGSHTHEDCSFSHSLTRDDTHPPPPYMLMTTDEIEDAMS